MGEIFVVGSHYLGGEEGKCQHSSVSSRGAKFANRWSELLL
jgi:hypothetical protein